MQHLLHIILYISKLTYNSFIMKNLVYFVYVAFTITVLVSCAVPRAGGVYGTESYGYSSSYKVSQAKSKADFNPTGSNNEIGFYIGVALKDINIADKWDIQPEVNFIGIKDLNQFQVPIFLKYNFVNKFNAYFGPNFGYLLDTQNGVNSFNFALDLGLSYDITDNFIAEARYDYGLSNLLDNGDSDNYIKLSGFQFGIAYRFNK